MIETTAEPQPAVPKHGAAGIAATYAAMSRRYAVMPLDGCTDSQRVRATTLARETSGIAADAASLPDIAGAPELSLQTQGKLMGLMSRIEGFERRRQIMQQDLEHMRTVR